MLSNALWDAVKNWGWPVIASALTWFTGWIRHGPAWQVFYLAAVVGIAGQLIQTWCPKRNSLIESERCLGMGLKWSWVTELSLLGLVGGWAWWVTPNTGFKLSIDDIAIFQPDNNHAKRGIMIDALIRNIGKPSVAIDWRLSIILTNGAIANAGISVIGPGITNSFHIDSLITLDAITETQEVGNPPRKGKLLFYTDASLQSLTNSATAFLLSVEDNYGRRYAKK